jgi:1-hydroxycarotenoid 3,4-desaturase
VAGTPHIVVVGAGVGGLVAALDLAMRGVAVTVLERAATPGGKLREVRAGGAAIDAGPTVFTMRWVFEEIFADAGAALSDHLTLEPAEILARHAWSADERLDLFADAARSEAAIGAFAGAAEARGFRDFCARARGIWRTLEPSFIRARKPTPLSLVRAAGLRGLGDLWRIAPFATLWSALGEHFADPRLRQLFGRYSTYAGSSPFLAPATLMLIAHVEQDGVWLVEGGMHRIARALAGLIDARGGRFRYAAHVAEIETVSGRTSGVRLATGERIAADAVVFNGDSGALAAGLLGGAVGRAAPAVLPDARSLSAVTWAMRARASGFPLLRHSVFFSRDYAAEFSDLFRAGKLPGAPTVYICAQDRGAADAPPPDGPERLLCLVNAPPRGDASGLTHKEMTACATATFALLTRCGLSLERMPQATVLTTPANFEELFPATGGALYGQAVHGPMASFRRPGARTKIRGLYLAGGGTHPGAGVPMAALSGRLAAASAIEDLASASRSRPLATRGGTSTR